MAESFQKKPQITPDQYLDILFRGKWFIIIPLCLSLTIGIGLTLTTDREYQASTLILVQPQRVPKNYVQSVVTSTISQRISTISQQILSRSNIEKIIEQFGLFKNTPNMYLEDKIAAMREKIKVRIERSRRQGTEAFSISYKGNEPQRVMRITNTLASYFMDENLKVREAQAIGTSEFLDSELRKTRKRLEEREQKLAAYRAKYMGGLPDELETNLRTLDRLQEQLSTKNAILSNNYTSLKLLESRYKNTILPIQLSASNTDNLSEDQKMSLTENEQKLKIAQKAYENLLLKYTSKHPDVLKAKKTVEKLTKIVRVENQNAAGRDNQEGIAQSGSGKLNQTHNSEMLQLKLIRNEIKKNKSEIAEIESRMKIYQQRVEDTPKRELELHKLKRDYQNIQDIFNSLLDRKLEAELSVNMEKKQKGEQFRIIDHARVPEKPTSPNVLKLFVLSIATGLGFGGGMILLKEVATFSVIRRNKQIEDVLGLNIIASIPPIEKATDKLKKTILTILFSGCCLYAVTCLGIFIVLNIKGLDRSINFIKMYINV